MGKIDFDKFIEEQRESATGDDEMDWIQQKKEWLAALEQFYGKIEGYLLPYIKTGDISLIYQDKSIDEEFIGEYVVKKMLIRMKDREAILEPIGTTLFGAKGHVELRGRNGLVRFVLVDKNASSPKVEIRIRTKNDLETGEKKNNPQKIDWEWKIATSPPMIEYVEMTDDSFFDALLEVING